MKSNKNIVLLGMMGAGKSSLGRVLSNKINLDFYDIDKIIEYEENSKITDIFNMEQHSVHIGKNTYTIAVRELLLKPKQTIVFKGRGLATINTKNMFAIGELSDVYIHIKLVV